MSLAKFLFIVFILALLFPGFFAAIIEGIFTAIFIIIVTCIVGMVIKASMKDDDSKTTGYAGW